LVKLPIEQGTLIFNIGIKQIDADDELCIKNGQKVFKVCRMFCWTCRVQYSKHFLQDSGG